MKWIAALLLFSSCVEAKVSKPPPSQQPSKGKKPVVVRTADGGLRHTRFDADK